MGRWTDHHHTGGGGARASDEVDFKQKGYGGGGYTGGGYSGGGYSKRPPSPPAFTADDYEGSWDTRSEHHHHHQNSINEKSTAKHRKP